MSTEINAVAEALFEKIRSRFDEVSLGDENAKATQTPEDARFFNFEYAVDGKSYGNITISLIDELALKVYFSKNITSELDDNEKKQWYSFLRELRFFAKRNMLTFEPRDITRSTLNIRDVKQASHDDSTFDRDEVVGLGESKMYGSKKRSYESYGPVRIKIQHTKQVDEEVHGARSRNIQAIFVENDQSERFKLPFTSLIGARAMARHVSAGGLPTDDLGEHITGLVSEMITLRPFVNAMRTRTFEDKETQGMLEAAFDYHRLLKHTLNKMKGKKGYNQFQETFNPQPANKQDIDVSDIKSKFVKRVMDERVEQALPLVHKAYQMMKENNNPFAKQFEQWADRLSEGTWAIPDTEEKVAKLNKLLKNPLPAGVDGANATGALYDIIGDDVLFDNIGDTGDIDPEADTRGLIVQWVDDNMPEIMDQLKGASGFVQMDEDDDDYDEPTPAEAVYDAILRRFQGNLDLVIKVGGPRETMDAIQDYVDSEDWSDLQEIGSSDVSAWVDNIVKQHSTPDSLERLKHLSGMEVKEGKMKELEMDLEELTDAEFVAKYKKTKQEIKAMLSEDELDESRMSDLHYDLENASDEEFEATWKSKKSDWQEIKNKDLRMDPNKPAYISKMKMHEEKPVYEAHEKLEKLVGQRVYVKNKGQTGTVDQVSTTHSNALVVDMDNGQTTVSHFTDLTSEDEKPSTLTRYLDMLKDVLDLHGRGAVHKKGLPAKSYDAMEEASDTHCSDECCGSDVKAEDCGCPPDCPHCNCNAKLDEAESYTQDDVNAAIKIANGSTGNMTDAVDRIESIEDGLADHPQVADALKKANESVQEMASLKRLSGLK